MPTSKKYINVVIDNPQKPSRLVRLFSLLRLQKSSEIEVESVVRKMIKKRGVKK